MPYHGVMLILRRVGRSIWVFLLPLLLGVVLVQAAVVAPAPAYALTPVTPQDDYAITATRALPPDAETPVVILYLPNLTWDRLQELYAKQSDMTGLQWLDDVAFANLSAPMDWGVSQLAESSDAGLYYCSENAEFPLVLYAIQGFINTELPKDATLVIVTAPLFDSRAPAAPSTELTPVIIYGGGYEGLLTSDITRRDGLITSADLVLLAQGNSTAPNSPASATNGPTSAPNSLYLNATMRSTQADSSPLERIQRLIHEKATTESVLATRVAANFAFLTLVFIAFALSIVLFFLGRRTKPGSRGALIPATRILWLIVLAFPIASFLMFSYLPAQPTPAHLVIAMVVWVTVISLVALLIGLKTKWVNSLIALFSLTILVIISGQLFGGPINSAGYFTYDITEGSRYYGLGNEQGAMLFGSWIALSGLLINRFPTASFIPLFKKWLYPLGSLFLLFIACSPWFGASFGPLVWGFLGCFVSWWLFNGRRLHWWLAVLLCAGAVGLALGTLYLDVALNPASHMSQVAPLMDQGPWAIISRLAGDVWYYSFSLMRDNVPLVLIIFLIFLFILLVVLRVLQPGGYREFWQRNQAFRSTYSVFCVLALITLLIEDSGAFTPAVLLIFPVACLVWLVCDLHSWHLRILAGDGPALSLRELQQQALSSLRGSSHATAADLPSLRAEPPEAERGNLGQTGAELGAMAEAPPTEPPVPTTSNGAPTDAQPSVARSTATMSVATLLSRVTGLVRSVATAMVLGTTLFASEYTIANNLPNMIYELVGGGILTTAFLPIYLAQLQKRGKEGAASFSSNILSISGIALALVALLATIFAPQVIFTQTFATPDLNVENAIFLFRFFAIQIVFYGVGAIINGLLNAHRRFLWPALGPVFNNLVLIITLFTYPLIVKLDPQAAKVWLAVGTTLGVVAMFAVQLPALIKLRIPLRFYINLKDPALVDTLKLALPVVAFIIMSIIGVSAMNAFGLAVTDSGSSVYYYAMLWFQLPYGVVAVALSTALLTEMSRASAAEDWDSFRSNVRLGLRTTLFLIIPLAAIFLTLSTQLAGLYHAGAFTAQDVQTVARVVAVWCTALPFYATYMFIYRVFTAKRDLKRFIIIDAMGRVLLVTLYGFFTTGFGLWEGLGLVGVPLADLCVYTLLCAIMLFVLHKELGSFGLTGIVKDGAKTLVAAGIAIVVPFTILMGSTVQGPLISFAMVAFFGMYALIVFYLMSRLLKIPEIKMVDSLLTRAFGLLRRRK